MDSASVDVADSWGSGVAGDISVVGAAIVGVAVVEVVAVAVVVAVATAVAGVGVKKGSVGRHTG